MRKHKHLIVHSSSEEFNKDEIKKDFRRNVLSVRLWKSVAFTNKSSKAFSAHAVMESLKKKS